MAAGLPALAGSSPIPFHAPKSTRTTAPMPTRSSFRISLRTLRPALVAAALVPAASATGQEPNSGAAAQPLDTTPVVLPEHDERLLSNGLRVIVVPDFTAEATVYTLLVPGGSAADPAGREGTAAVLAMLMEAVGEHDPRTALGVTASADALALTLVDSTSTMPAAARRLGDAIRRVQVTDSAVAAAREERMEAVGRALEQPDVAANRVLLRAVYGDHPYGRGETVETLRRVTPDDVRGWRESFLRPDAAVLSVTGPVEADETVRLLEAGFRGWERGRGRVPEPASEPLERGLGGRRLLVHRPGLPQAVIQLGQALPEAPHPDWTELAVLDQVLSAGPDAPLVTVRPPGAAEGIVAGTVTAAQRRRGRGVFQARAAVRTAVAADVVEGLLVGLAEAGESFVSPGELRPVQSRMAGSFRAQVSVPAGAAALMAVNRILGLPDSLMASYPVRVRRIGPQELRDVASRHLDTARVSVVVMGDATLLREDLEALGPFELLDASGAPLAEEDLEVLEDVPDLDAAGLVPVTMEYRVVVQDQQVGTIRRVLAPGPDSLPPSMVLRSTASLGPQEVTQHVAFTVPDFRPLSAGAAVSAQGQSAGMEVTVGEGRVTGSVDTGAGRTAALDVALPPGALLGDMLELAVWLVPLEEGAAYRLRVLDPETGDVRPVVLRVGPVEDVTVPAGTFRARRVEMGGDQPQTYWVRIEEPRIPLRMVPAGRPVVLELVSVTPGA